MIVGDEGQSGMIVGDEGQSGMIVSLFIIPETCLIRGPLMDLNEVNKGCQNGLLILEKIGLKDVFRISPCRLTRSAPPMPEGTVLSECVLGLKGAFGGLVFSPLAGNPGATVVECPILYNVGMRSTFNDNRDGTNLPTKECNSEGYQVCFQEKEIEQDCWTGFKGKLQNAFVMSKDKDLNKKRPICPSFVSPVRQCCRRGMEVCPPARLQVGEPC